MASLLTAYDRALTRSPILTKTLTSMALFALGDIMSQKMEKGRNSELDTARTMRMTAWGAMFTPLAHAWYAKLDAFFPGKGAAIVAKKVAADQLTWTVAINTLFFFTSTFMVTGDVGKSTDAIKEKLWPTLKVNWVVWPVLQAVNLSVVPLQYRILFVNFASLFWSAYLSSVANAAPSAPSAPAAAQIQ